MYYVEESLGERLELGQDSRQKFGYRRMDMHGTLYGRIGCFCIHHIQQNVYDFIASSTKDRRTENLF